MKAIAIKVDTLRSPLGLQNRNPRITWVCDEGKKQVGYQYTILVNNETKYTSDFIESSDMFFAFPITLQDRDLVEVQITLQDENKKEETTSTTFEMGINDWKAKWIQPELEIVPERQPASYLKKEFVVTKVGQARLYITAHGLYEAHINQKRVGDFILAPGTDDYRKRIQYQTYDVTDFLQEGTNVIEVTLGDGWYRGNNGIDGANHIFGDDIALLCQLEIEKEVVVISDQSWLASQEGPIRLNDLELGEVYDSRKEKITSWHEVKEVSHPYDVVVASDEVFIQEQEHFKGERIETPNGEIVYDFKQNLAGYSAFTVNAKEGQKITIWHGETLDQEGNFTQKNIDPGNRNKNGGIPQKVEYICKEGMNTYKPTFSIFGFQYIKVETDVDLSDASFEAIAVYSAMPETATFECSNADVNQLFHNSMWSMKSNFVDIPTDCPHRERSGWTGDAGVFVHTGSLLHDSYTVFEKWLTECRFAQKKNGVVANIAPPIHTDGGGFSTILDGSTGWGDAIVIVPYTLYKFYGDKKILEDNYEAMTKWVQYLGTLAKKKKLANLFRNDPLNPYVIEKGFHWGEWCQPDVDSGTELKNTMMKGAPKSATAYYYYSVKLLSEISGILGKTKECERLDSLSRVIKEAYLKYFTNNGIVESDRQCDYVRPLAFGLLDKEEENARKLNALIKKSDYHLNTGFLSTPFLCPVLCKYGYVDTAYRLLLQESRPSWLYAVKKGATTIWENWNGLDAGDNASLNHYSYGAVSGWLIDGVCGIQVQDGTCTIKPQPYKLLEYAKATYDSPLGKVESGWKYNGDKIEYTFVIPANVEATLILPSGETTKLQSGKHTMVVNA